jgi:hypothetical protein
LGGLDAQSVCARRVTEVELDRSRKEVLVRVGLKGPVVLGCPECGRAMPGYDARERCYVACHLARFARSRCAPPVTLYPGSRREVFRERGGQLVASIVTTLDESTFSVVPRFVDERTSRCSVSRFL